MISIISLAITFVLYNFKTSELNNEQRKPENIINEPDQIYDKLQIFPELNRYVFYDEIKIEKGLAIIDEDMIAKVINYVIEKSQNPYGDISYGYKRINNQSVLFTFKWNSGTKIYNYSYLFEIDKL